MPLSLADLVANRTLSPDMAATLAAAAEARRSLLCVAIPRMAGKSTVLQAALAHIPPDTAVHHLASTRGPSLGIPEVTDGGYLFASEISPAGFADYLWGADARRLFAEAQRGFSIATALHASGVEEAFEVLRMNGIPDAHAARIELVAYIRSLGPWYQPRRRVVAELHEVLAVTDGRPDARLLHAWDEASDTFEVCETPRRVVSGAVRLAALTRQFRTV